MENIRIPSCFIGYSSQNYAQMPLRHFTKHLMGTCLGTNSKGVGTMWHAQSLFLTYIFSREISSSLLSISQKGLRDRGSLVVKKSEHKRTVVLMWFRTCKGILQDSGTLKRISWGLDVGSRVWLNQYKFEFAFSLPLNSFIVYCLLFLFSKFNLHYYLGVLV